MSGQEKDWDKSKTRYYLDEYFGSSSSKGENEFGPRALECVRTRIRIGWKKYAPTLPAGAPSSPDECMNEFWVKRYKSLHQMMDAPSMRNDATFESKVAIAVNGWFLNLFKETASGKMRDVVRNRLGRAKDRFTNDNPQKYWGLVGGPSTPSTAIERELRPVVSRYPIDINRKALNDSDRKRMPPYGKPGQMENLLEGTIEAAQGTLPLNTLFRLVEYRLPIMKDPETARLVDNENNPIDIAAVPTTAEDIAIETMRDQTRKEQIMYILAAFGEHENDRTWVRQFLRTHSTIRERLQALGIDPNKQKA